MRHNNYKCLQKSKNNVTLRRLLSVEEKLLPVDVILKDIIFHHMICHELSAPGRNICLGLTVRSLLVKNNSLVN